MLYQDIQAFKYRLARDIVYRLPGWKWGAARVGPYVTITQGGLLRIKTGYLWDGPSGPTRDRKENLFASLIHDALYELLRAGCVPFAPGRKYADALMRDLCIASGMSPFWAKWYYYLGLRSLAAWAAKRRKSRKYDLLHAPSPGAVAVT